jgi:hypothetical protein
MNATTEPRESPPAQQPTEENRPPSKLGSWAIALIFLAALVLLIVTNM